MDTVVDWWSLPEASQLTTVLRYLSLWSYDTCYFSSDSW